MPMNCTYTWKGTHFESELALDQALLDAKSNDLPLDLVYSMGTITRQHVVTQLIEKNSKSVQEMLENGEAELSELNVTDAQDIDRYTILKGVHKKENSTGVTGFLATREKSPGHPLFPLFRPESYWEHKFIILSGGSSSAEDMISKEEYEELQQILGREDVRNIVEKSDKDKIRAYYTEKWKEQSKYGNSIHEVLRIALTAQNGKYPVDITDMTKLVNKVEKEFRRSSTHPKRADKYANISTYQIQEICEYAKQLVNDLRLRFGQNAVFMPEIVIGASLTPEDVVDPATGKLKHWDSLNGIIDLLVIDQYGNPQIIDYKTSDKPYDKYDSAKKRTFYYQLGLYHRLIGRTGVNLTASTRLYIAPLEMQDFRKEDDVWNYNKLLPYTETYGSLVAKKTHLKDITEDVLMGPDANTIQKHLDESMPLLRKHMEGPTKVLDYVKQGMQQLFNVFEFNEDVEETELLDYIHKHGYDKKNIKDEYTFEVYYPEHKIIRTTNFDEIKEAVKDRIQGSKDQVPKWAQNIKSQIIDAKEQQNFQYHFSGVGNVNMKKGEANWLTHQLSRYINNGWDISEKFESFEELGIIVLEHKFTHQFNFIKIINRPVDGLVKLNGNKYLTGRFQSDIVEDSKSKSLALESTYANLAMMETMLAINSNPQLFSNAAGSIGEIVVINPADNNGKTASNKELAYNFNSLCRLSGRNDSNFTFNEVKEPDKIQLQSTIDIVKNHFSEILQLGDIHTMAGLPKGLDACKTKIQALNSFTNPEEAKSALMDLIHTLDKHFPELQRISTQNVDDNISPQVRLMRELLFAVSEIDGYDQRQQNRDDSKWGANIGKILRGEGHSGTELDNQGFLSNPSLNRLAKATTIAYQNTREQVQRVKEDLDPFIQKMKDATGFGYFKSRTFGNQSAIYHDLIDWDYKDDLIFKDPKDVADPDQRAMLERALYHINKNRLIAQDKRNNKKYVEDTLATAYRDNPLRYLQVPLKIGTASAQAANQGGLPGLFRAFKEKLRAINPMTAAQYLSETAENFTENVRQEEEWTNVNVSEQIQHNSMWHMVNSFARGEGNDRLNYIQEMGREAFETNLETLVLEQEFAYSSQQNLDEIFPMIRATMLNVAFQGSMDNFKFAETLEYIGKYIRNKIFNQSLVSEESKGFKIFAGKAQQWASKLALAFSPAQLYQHLDGIWKDVALTYRKPDGSTSFTKKNMFDAYFFVYRDLVRFGDNRSLCEALNQVYGINDMDMNAYVEKIKTDQGGFFNFNSLMFRMASRPDFYNRMTLFGAQMRGDGCWDAHYMEDGKLKYKMELDKRFDLFAKLTPREAQKLTGDMLTKYNKQKAMYIAMADQMKLEHTRDNDGNLFTYNLLEMDKVPTPLPKAYTTEQSEGMKALGDLVYGYYSHEKKSIVSSSTIGGLVMQMNTYWSSKKNQFLAPGGIRYMGRMEHYYELQKDENGEIVTDADGNGKRIYYYQVVNENGELEKDELGNTIIIPQDQVTDNMKTIPFMQYKGQFQEGIFVTLIGFGKMVFNNRSKGWAAFVDTMNYYWNNPDEDIRRAYRSNLNQAWMDLLGWLLIGCIAGPALEEAAKDYYKENENDTLSEASLNALYALGANLVESSGNDFNALKAISGIGLSWTPFSVKTYTRLIQNVGNVLGGDKSFYQAMVNSFAATRSIRPVFDYVGEETGWNVARNDEEEE